MDISWSDNDKHGILMMLLQTKTAQLSVVMSDSWCWQTKYAL